jgi:glycosyltransferase involved in cell wall biosynthesis
LTSMFAEPPTRLIAVLTGPYSALDSLEALVNLLSSEVGRSGRLTILAGSRSLDTSSWSVLRNPGPGNKVLVVPEIIDAAHLLRILEPIIRKPDIVVLLRSNDRLNDAALREAEAVFQARQEVVLSVVSSLVDEFEELVPTTGGPLSIIEALSGRLPTSAFIISAKVLIGLAGSSIPLDGSPLDTALLVAVLTRSTEVVRLRGGELRTGYRSWQDEFGVRQQRVSGLLKRNVTGVCGRRIASSIEHNLAPRYAIISLDSDRVRVLSDATQNGLILKVSEFMERLCRFVMLQDLSSAIPNHLVFVDEKSLEAIARSRLSNWLMSEIARNLKTSAVAAYRLRHQAGHVTVVPSLETSTISEAQIVALRTGTFLDVAVKGDIDWLTTLLSGGSSSIYTGLVVSTPFWNPEEDSAVSLPASRPEPARVAVGRVSVRLRMGLPQALAAAHPDDAELQHRALEASDQLATLFGQGNARATRCASGTTLRVAFMLPLMSFGGVERVTLRIAERLRKAGCHTTLIILNDHNIWDAQDVATAFDEVFFVGTPASLRESLWANGEAWERAAAFAMSADVVVHSQVHDWPALIEPLRQAGVAIIPYIHLAGVSWDGARVGMPYIAAEALIGADGAIVISEQLRRWCGAQGFADDKTLLVRNASSHKFDQALVEQSRRDRQLRSASLPLRVLYIGRLDPEKGLSRLTELARLMESTPRKVELRIVGASVIGGQLSEQINAHLVPATFDASEISKHLDWADVLLITSYYEGVPLTILEAMQFGVVPISTSVGAISEVVKDGVNGFLVESHPTTTVDNILERISRLDLDRELMKRMAENAALRQSDEAAWDEAGEAVLAFLKEAVAARTSAIR